MNPKILAILLTLAPSLLRAEDPVTFTSEPFSLTISAPATWRLVPADFPTQEYDLHKKNAVEVVGSHENLPIVRIAKPVADKFSPVPIVQVFVVADKGLTPTEFLKEMIKSAAAAFEDFHITQEATDTTLNGVKAAVIESRFVASFTGGHSFPTLSRVWAVPRDKMIFVISLTGRPDDLKALSKDTDFIMKSIHFKNQ